MIYKIKKLLFIFLALTFSSCQKDQKTNQSSKQYVFTHYKDGEAVETTVTIEDTFLLNELQRMMTDPNYRPRKRINDTIFNSKGKPVTVKLGDSIFGATIQKFEYDKQDRLVKISGFDNEENIKPFYHDIALQLNKYDHKGNLVEIRHLGENGELISSEFEDTPIIRIKYDDKNRKVEKRYLDENEKLRSEFAIVRYEYDDRGERSIKGWYNENGEKKK